jgi:predicted nucleotidyltransferase
MKTSDIVDCIKAELPTLLAVYAFGSQIQGTATAASDLDLAVLIEGTADPVRLFYLSGELADIAGCVVDLVDLRTASTVMQYQIISTGQLLWTRDSAAQIYESFILSEKTALDEARSALLAEIKTSGRIYDR